MLESVIDTGRVILELRRGGKTAGHGRPEELIEQCRDLSNHRGEASGLALASEILSRYQQLSPEGRILFFELLNRDFSVDPDAVIQAAERYRHQPDDSTLAGLSKAVESPRQKLFRRMNMAPGGTSALVKMREHLLGVVRERPELRPIDTDLRQLLIAWFNRGFLMIDRINWNSPAAVLEKIIKYEAVHEINGWEDLRRRLEDDRRCFAFFHPAMPDDPVIFVEIALNSSSATAIKPLIGTDRSTGDARHADTATFYSISNCHKGLQGISFGNFLIKQVTQELQIDLPNIKNFETLSPIPGFREWLTSDFAMTTDDWSTDVQIARQAMSDLADAPDQQLSDPVRNTCMKLCAHYLLNEKSRGGPLDPVARFHLGNGASMERINWAADGSEAGLSRSLGIMVNYVYRPSDIEKNHDAYFAENQIAASTAMRKLAKR